MKRSAWWWIPSHVAAALLGVGIMIMMNPRHPSAGATGVTPSQPEPATTPMLPPDDFKRTWDELATTPMTANERDMLKDHLVELWQKLEPAGLLDFLEHKHAWPSAAKRLWRELFTSKLPITHPDRLFEFTRHYGYDPAHFGIGQGDPEVWKKLVLALPEPDRGAVWSRLLVETDAAPHTSEAMSLYQGGRLDEFRRELEKIAAPEDRKSFAEWLARTMQVEKIDESLAGKLLELPEDLREAVGESIFWDLRSTGMSSVAARDERRRVAEKLARAGLPAAAKAALSTMSVDNWSLAFDRAAGHRENINWVRTLPEEPVFDSIRKAVFEVWTQEDPEAAIAGIPSLPAGHGRDLAAATVVDTARHYNPDNSEARQTKLRQLIGLIDNLELRKPFDETENREESTGDPFADPFAP